MSLLTLQLPQEVRNMKSLVLLCLFGLALAEGKKCGENSSYNSCGTMCPLTCDNYNDPPKACVLMCNPGCHCDEGYVKTKDGRCVKPENCPASTAVEDVCGENQHYESCGTSCPLTCGNWMDPPKICNLRCNSGCYCNKGYVKTDDGRCVRPENCPANSDLEVCGENKHYESCGTMCPLTCDNYNDPPKACVLMCNPGCHCDEGYVKTKDGRCVKPENCPANAGKKCGENQHYNSCGSMCPLTCDNYNDPPKACVLMCNPGCHCDEGYVKTKDGRCDEPENCEANAEQCGANERYNECGTACPLTCDNYRNPPKFCNMMCVVGCECEKGFVKNRDGQCVRPEECSSINSIESDSCDLPAETGVCRGFFPRYYFDRTTGQCQKFVYGGCGGNENNFETVEQCQNKCGVRASSDLCKLPSETGRCFAYFPRYYYNSETRKCEKFIYGGCGGNENNFKTQEACEETCGSS